MSTNPSLKPFETECSNINGLESTLSNLSTDLQHFNTISAQIEKIEQPFPIKISENLTTFYSGLQETGLMIQELDKITLDKLNNILTGAYKGVQTIMKPVPGIINDIKSITTLFPQIQSEVASLQSPSKGVESNISNLDAQLQSWSNTDPRAGGQTGTGLLNAVYYEMLVAIKDNVLLKHKYDTEINSIVNQLNTMASALKSPIASLSSNGALLDSQLKNLNSYLQKYYSILTNVVDLSAKVEPVVAFLDKFKPDVDLVYGIMKPLSWFIALIESKACKPSLTDPRLLPNREERSRIYADAALELETKFELFEQWLSQLLEGQDIEAIEQAEVLPNKEERLQIYSDTDLPSKTKFELLEEWISKLLEQHNIDSLIHIKEVPGKEERLRIYNDTTSTPKTKFEVFEQWVYLFFVNNNIGKKIENVLSNLFPLDRLATAVDTLNKDLIALSKDTSLSDLNTTFASIVVETKAVQKELAILSTAAKRATGTVILSRALTNTTETLKRGTYLSDKTGALLFVTTEEATFKSGEFTTPNIKAQALSVGTAGNVAANAIVNFVSALVKQKDGTFKREPNPVNGDTFSINSSSAFTGGTDMSASEIQGEANALANKMLPQLLKYMS